MRMLARLLILLAPWLTGCKSSHSRQSADDAPVRRPVVNAFLNGRPSLSDERAAAQPVEDALRRKELRFGHEGGIPWQFGP